MNIVPKPNNWKILNNSVILNQFMKLLGLFILILISSIPIVTAQTGSNPDKTLTEVNVFTTYQPHSAEFFKDYLYIADGNSSLI